MAELDVYPETLPRRRRLFVAAVVIAAHLTLLISVNTQSRTVVALPEGGQAGVSVEIVEIAARPTPASPPQAEIPPTPTPNPPTPPPITDVITPELIEHPEALDLPAPSTDLEPMPVNAAATRPQAAMAKIPSDDPCHYAQILQTALQGDDAVRRALTLIPRGSRSVANAIMVWNGQWVPVNALGGEASLSPVRTAIVQSLTATSAECLKRLNTGPLFITIQGWPETTVLALGSGQWRASDLIAQPPELDPAQTPPGPESIWTRIWPG